MTFRSSLVLVMESPKNKPGDSPEGGAVADVTGISRSGRVRKKSSKLTDFESPDEIDIRFKRRTERPPKSPQKILKQEQPVVSDIYDDSDGYIDDDLLEIKDEPLDVDDWGEDDDDEMDVDDNDGGDMGSESLHVDEDSTDAPRETSNFNQSQSLYLSEKQAKKSIMLKDGQVVQRKKAQRKDKGKSRFTAYMLWAREVRPGIIQANPQMDFSAVNKRLGELWALVPTSQKYNWKRRAKRLAAKGNQKGSMISTGKAAKQPGSIARSNLINKGGVKPQTIRSSKPSETNQNVAGSTPKTPVSASKLSQECVKCKKPYCFEKFIGFGHTLCPKHAPCHCNEYKKYVPDRCEVCSNLVSHLHRAFKSYLSPLQKKNCLMLRKWIVDGMRLNGRYSKVPYVSDKTVEYMIFQKPQKWLGSCHLGTNDGGGTNKHSSIVEATDYCKNNVTAVGVPRNDSRIKNCNSEVYQLQEISKERHSVDVPELGVDVCCKLCFNSYEGNPGNIKIKAFDGALCKKRHEEEAIELVDVRSVSCINLSEDPEKVEIKKGESDQKEESPEPSFEDVPELDLIMHSSIKSFDQELDIGIKEEDQDVDEAPELDGNFYSGSSIKSLEKSLNTEVKQEDCGQGDALLMPNSEVPLINKEGEADRGPVEIFASACEIRNSPPDAMESHDKQGLSPNCEQPRCGLEPHTEEPLFVSPLINLGCNSSFTFDDTLALLGEWKSLPHNWKVENLNGRLAVIPPDSFVPISPDLCNVEFTVKEGFRYRICIPGDETNKELDSDLEHGRLRRAFLDFSGIASTHKGRKIAPVELCNLGKKPYGDCWLRIPLSQGDSICDFVDFSLDNIWSSILSGRDQVKPDVVLFLNFMFSGQGWDNVHKVLYASPVSVSSLSRALSISLMELDKDLIEKDTETRSRLALLINCLTSTLINVEIGKEVINDADEGLRNSMDRIWNAFKATCMLQKNAIELAIYDFLVARRNARKAALSAFEKTTQVCDLIRTSPFSEGLFDVGEVIRMTEKAKQFDLDICDMFALVGAARTRSIMKKN